MSVTETGIDAVADAFQGLDASLRGGMVADAADIMRPAQTLAQVYGPELSGQAYQRTYALQAGWAGDPTARPTGGGVVISKTNDVDYAEYVQVNQAALFAGRWDSLEQIAEQATPAVVAEVTETISKELRRRF